MKKAKKERLSNLLTVSVCLAIVISLGISVYALPHESFSERENRALSGFPSFSAQAVSNGSFFSDISDFYSDQFAYRDLFVSLKTTAERLLLKRESNGIILAKDGYLLNKGNTSTDILQKNLLALKSLDIPKSRIFIVPRAIDVLSDFLPKTYGTTVEENTRKLIHTALPNAIYADGQLKNAAKNGGYVWFKTDHHWTADGAYIAYLSLAESLGFTPYAQSEFAREAVSTDFLGSTYSKSGLYSAQSDSIVLYRYAEDSSLTVHNRESGTVENGLYHLDKLSKKDKYLVFLGGNYAHISITDGSGTRPSLLIVKDSYANALIPFLARHFDLEIIDPRYYRGSISDLTKSLSPSDTLFLFGISTLEDTPLFQKN